MAEVATMDAVEALRREVREEMLALREELREEIRGARTAPDAVTDAAPAAGSSPDGALDWLERAARLRESILRRRGGVPLPPSADEIRRLREERIAAILGEQEL